MSYPEAKEAYMPEAVSRGFQGGGATPLSKSGGCEGPPCASHPLIFATPLIDHQGGAGDPPVIFDIFDSGFYMICFNIVIYV